MEYRKTSAAAAKGGTLKNGAARGKLPFLQSKLAKTFGYKRKKGDAAPVHSTARAKRTRATSGEGASSVVKAAAASGTKLSTKQQTTGIVDGRSKLSLSEKERLDCVREYFLTGNMLAIARKRNISYASLSHLAREDWWKEELKALEHEAAALLKVKLTRIMGSALDQLEDRIEHGNEVWKEGELRTVPLSAADLTTIAATIFSKKRELEQDDKGLGTNEARRLLSLAEALRSHALPPSTVEIMEGELVEASSDTGSSDSIDDTTDA